MNKSVQNEDQAHVKTNAKKHSKHKNKTKTNTPPPHLTKRLH